MGLENEDLKEVKEEIASSNEDLNSELDEVRKVAKEVSAEASSAANDTTETSSQEETNKKTPEQERREMIEVLNSYDAQRAKVMKEHYIMIACGVGFFALCVILGAVIPFYFLFFVGLLVLVALVSSAVVKKQKFAFKFKNNVITDIVYKTLGQNARYNIKGTIDYNEFMRPRLFMAPDKWRGEDLICSQYGKVTYQMSDLELQERKVYRDSKGNEHVKYETYFKGRFMVFDYPGDINKSLKVTETTRNGFDTQKFEKLETESTMFNKKFKAYASTKEDGFYILTPSLIEKMLQLEGMYKGSIYYAFLYGKLYVAINNNSDSLEINMNKKLDEKFLDKILGDINIAAAIVHEFGLDRQKFDRGNN